MSYSNIFATYKSVTPPKRRTQKWEEMPQEDTYDPNIINFLIPSAIPTVVQEQPQKPQQEFVAPPLAVREPTPEPPSAPSLTPPSRPTVSYNTNSLLKVDIEDLLRQEGITKVNGKAIKFGNKGLRSANANYGSKKSHHKERDPHTGNANARDISIVGGTDADYTEFRRMLLGNDRVRAWFAAKNWGIINELTSAVMSRTKATGRHFHFGPDKWAKRTWAGWLDNPNVSVTKVF